ncbi:hypothetical protein LOD99_4211 [Oopsacas minuta]|uniref:Uncharacterized protein n=1 Tax=Oopsacas minuta TaxID=111878 RepID=A0AAV7JWV6_9METZ|nr:hypothetical protein LOD99_4211 [Oopsacas minuta]
MTDDIIKIVEPHIWMDTTPEDVLSQQESTAMKVDMFLSEVDSMTDLSLSKTSNNNCSESQQEHLIWDPLSISPGKALLPTERSRVLVKDMRSLQSLTESISALVTLCQCSIPKAVYAFHTCSANVFTAKQLLDGKGGQPWTSEEDKLLFSRSLVNISILLKNRTPRELKQRISYYNLT